MLLSMAKYVYTLMFIDAKDGQFTCGAYGLNF